MSFFCKIVKQVLAKILIMSFEENRITNFSLSGNCLKFLFTSLALLNNVVLKTAITLAKKTVGRPSADLSADHRPIYRPIKCQISALFSSADKK